MGHYYGVEFRARLTDVGSAIIAKLYETRNWRETAEFFTEHKFVEAFEQSRPVPIPFAEGDHEHNPETRVWDVHVLFKDRGQLAFREMLESFLAFIVTEPTTLRVSHDLWEAPVRMVVQPKCPPEPDWDRRYGD